MSYQIKFMFKEPKEQAKIMFNKLRFMEGENKNCITCDCVVKPILIYMIDEILNSNPSGWFYNGFEWEKDFLGTHINEGWVDGEKYWNAVKSVVSDF